MQINYALPHRFWGKKYITGVSLYLDENMSNSWFFENFSGVPDDFFDDATEPFDLPLEDIELHDDGEDWEAKFQHLEPPPSSALVDISSGFADSGNWNGNLKLSKASLLDDGSSQPKQWSATEMLSGRSFPLQYYSLEKKYPHPFRTLSPVSVLESSGSSCSAENLKSCCPSLVPPKRPRSKCPRPPRRTFHPISTCSSEFFRHAAISELESEFLIDDKLSSSKKKEKKRNLTLVSSTIETKQPSSRKPVEVRQCSHCAVTSTPQWREGPNGPKTLCNACGVRFRSGRLLPEYRPAASPTFIPSLHSNSHRKVLEMRTTSQSTPANAVDLLEELPTATDVKLPTAMNAKWPMAPENSF